MCVCKYTHVFVLTNEIVVLSRLKFESAGLRRERPERYGDVHQFVRLVAIRYDSRIGISDSAHIVFLLGHLKQRRVTVKRGLHARGDKRLCIIYVRYGTDALVRVLDVYVSNARTCTRD